MYNALAAFGKENCNANLKYQLDIESQHSLSKKAASSLDAFLS